MENEDLEICYTDELAVTRAPGGCAVPGNLQQLFLAQPSVWEKSEANLQGLVSIAFRVRLMFSVRAVGHNGYLGDYPLWSTKYSPPYGQLSLHSLYKFLNSDPGAVHSGWSEEVFVWIWVIPLEMCKIVTCPGFTKCETFSGSCIIDSMFFFSSATGTFDSFWSYSLEKLYIFAVCYPLFRLFLSYAQAKIQD